MCCVWRITYQGVRKISESREREGRVSRRIVLNACLWVKVSCSRRSKGCDILDNKLCGGRLLEVVVAVVIVVVVVVVVVFVVVVVKRMGNSIVPSTQAPVFAYLPAYIPTGR